MADSLSTPVVARRRALALIALFWVCTIAILIGTGMLRGLAPPRFSALAWGLLGSIGILGLSAAFLRWEHRGASSAGLHLELPSIGRFGMGFTIGGVLYGGYLFLLRTLAGVRIVSSESATASAFGLALATYLGLSIMEELGFRGYALRRLEETVGRFPALGIGAAVFGALHLAYGWAPGTAILGAASGGLLFGIAALVSRGLAMPIGLHAAWNIADWSVGAKDGGGMWRLVVTDPTTAARVGSVSFMAMMLVGFLGFWLAGRRRDS